MGEESSSSSFRVCTALNESARRKRPLSPFRAMGGPVEAGPSSPRLCPESIAARSLSSRDLRRSDGGGRVVEPWESGLGRREPGTGVASEPVLVLDEEALRVPLAEWDDDDGIRGVWEELPDEDEPAPDGAFAPRTLPVADGGTLPFPRTDPLALFPEFVRSRGRTPPAPVAAPLVMEFTDVVLPAASGRAYGSWKGPGPLEEAFVASLPDRWRSPRSGRRYGWNPWYGLGGCWTAGGELD